MKFTPISDFVVLKPLEAEETTEGGIILAGSAKKRPSIAEVVAVGPGGMVNGREVAMNIKPGDKVIAERFTGSDVTMDGETFKVVHQNEIIALVV